MKGFTFTKQTQTVALTFFTIYFLYGIFMIPFTQLFISLFIGAIVASLTKSYEFGAIGVLGTNFLLGTMMRKSGYEGFMATDPAEISARIGSMKKGPVVPTVSGVGSKMTEGFADASGNDMTINPEKKEESTNTTPVTAESKPGAPTTTAAGAPTVPATPPMGLGVNAPMGLGVKTPTQISEQGIPPVQSEKFQDNGSLFKIGQIPTDVKGGFHIDAGTTVMNALNALKPDQIQAMTKDTQSLIDTQKSLMNMLQNFQPMVSEGKQMMDTFQSMFGPTAGALNSAKNTLTGATA